jgi:hypothetical protein
VFEHGGPDAGEVILEDLRFGWRQIVHIPGKWRGLGAGAQ